MKQFSIVVVGATGMVGRSFLQVLNERNFPINKFSVLASDKSAGTEIEYRGKKIIVEKLTENSFDSGFDIALFATEGDVSRIYAPIAASKGCVAIDNSSAFRMDENVPLIVPEVNPESAFTHKGIIANPNCSTIQAVVALSPLNKKYGIKRIVYSTYQAVSGAGQGGVLDLENGLKGEAPMKFPHPITGNCIPHIDVFLDNGYSKEESKMIEETKKILGDQSLRITATTVRVPVLHGHSESINVEFTKGYDLDELIDTLRNAKGIVVQNDYANNEYPMPIYAAGHDEVYVGRIRRDYSVDSGINMWVVSDNTRKGAATNAVQIAELLISRI